MKNVSKELVRFVEIYSKDYQNEESLATLLRVLYKVNRNHHHSVVLPAIHAMSETAYEAFRQYLYQNGCFDEVWIFDIYREAPIENQEVSEENQEVVVEEFDEEDLSFIK